MVFSASFLLSLLVMTATSAVGANSEWYYLKSGSGMYISSSITYNGNINYVLLTDKSLAQPLYLFAGDGSITVNMSNVIGASAQAPLYLSDADGFSKMYKEVVLGDDMDGSSTSGFAIADDGTLSLTKDDFFGFFACSAAKGVKQLYWANQDREEAASCEKVTFTRHFTLE